MTRIPLAERSFAKLAVLLLFLAVLTAVPSHADGPQDLEIMVNGAWSLVVYADPNMYGGEDRLYLVAPADKVHFASIWSGPNASMGNWMNLLQKHDPSLHLICPSGSTDSSDQSDCKNNSSKQYLYLVDFDPTKPNQIATLDEEIESVYAEKTRISSKTVAALLSTPGSSRYAISLPVPDHIHTYSGDFGPGVTEVRVETGKDPTLDTSIATYATWTILHYDRQNANQLSVTTKTSGDATSFNLVQSSLTDREGSQHKITRYGISISLSEAPLCTDSVPPDKLKYYPQDCPNDVTFLPVPGDDQECDVLSGFSFAESATFWSLPDHLYFPSEQDIRGTQSPWNYDFTCDVSNGANLSKLRNKQQQVAIGNLEYYLAAAKLSQKISVLRQRLGYDTRGTSQSQQQQNSGQARGKTVSVREEFQDISSDLGSLFKGNVPSNLGDKLFCACSVETRGKCQVPGSPTLECDKADAKTQFEQFEELAAYNLHAQDKGSSDCHAPQISINGAIQPQP